MVGSRLRNKQPVDPLWIGDSNKTWYRRQLDFTPVQDVFTAMTTEQIGGHSLSTLIGGGNPEVIAREISKLLINHGGLLPNEGVLDLGCGCGRIAAALTQYLSPRGSYVGIDIVPGFVEFGRKFISKRYPNFEFLLLNQENQTYDWWRQRSKTDRNSLAEVAGLEPVDLAIAISLFTHLDFEKALGALAAMRSSLKDSGRALVTVFLLDEYASDAMRAGKTGFSFKFKTPSGKLLAEKIEEPTYAVAYTNEMLANVLRLAGFSLEKVVRGYWSTFVPDETFQDALLLRKA